MNEALQPAEQANRIYTRKTETYNPVPDMIQIDSLRNDGSKQLYLEIKYRIQWFNVWCAENGMNGYIDESDITVVSEGPSSFVMAKSTVYIDGKPCGKSAAGVPLYELDGHTLTRYPVQLASTYATGRALAKAGFGTANAGSASEYGREDTCDAGIPFVPEYPTDPNNPMMLLDEPIGLPNNRQTVQQRPAAEPSTKRRTPAPAPAQATPMATQPRARQNEAAVQPPVTRQNPVPAEPASKPIMSLEDAYKFICPIGQKTKGKSMGEVNALFPNMIEFYAGDKFQDNGRPDRAQLKTAAQLILNESKRSA